MRRKCTVEEGEQRVKEVERCCNELVNRILIAFTRKATDYEQAIDAYCKPITETFVERITAHEASLQALYTAVQSEFVVAYAPIAETLERIMSNAPTPTLEHETETTPTESQESETTEEPTQSQETSTETTPTQSEMTLTTPGQGQSQCVGIDLCEPVRGYIGSMAEILGKMIGPVNQLAACCEEPIGADAKEKQLIQISLPLENSLYYVPEPIEE